jgi:hypothetical protein
MLTGKGSNVLSDAAGLASSDLRLPQRIEKGCFAMIYVHEWDHSKSTNQHGQELSPQADARATRTCPVAIIWELTTYR